MHRRLTLLSAVALPLLLLLASAVSVPTAGEACFFPQTSNDDWPMYQHDPAHSGRTSATVFSDGPLYLQWAYAFGERVEVEAQPVIADGVVYQGVMNGEMHAIDADTGKNMLFTLNDVAKSVDFSSIRRTFSAIATRACENGTGFSGTAIAAYLTGFSSCLSKNEARKLDAENFVMAMEEGTKSAYLSFRSPKEGTIVSVMRVSAAKAKEKLQIL